MKEPTTVDGEIIAVCTSEKKGTRKQNVGQARLIPNHGLEGDAHASDWHRQVSLLAQESIDKMRAAGLNVGPGAFAENLTTKGIELPILPIGTRLRAGDVEMEVTQIGKVCHTKCAIFYMAGDCVMPREGIFAKVLTEGVIKVGDRIGVTVPGE
jgi:MOSC domain-containing protein YiiM